MDQMHIAATELLYRFISPTFVINAQHLSKRSASALPLLQEYHEHLMPPPPQQEFQFLLYLLKPTQLWGFFSPVQQPSINLH